MQLLKRLWLTPRHIAKRNENMGPKKDLCGEFSNSFIQRALNWSNPNVHQRGINKLWHIHTVEHYLTTIKRINDYTRMNFRNILLSRINQTQECVLYDAIYMNFNRQNQLMVTEIRRVVASRRCRFLGRAREPSEGKEMEMGYCLHSIHSCLNH